MSRAIFEAPMSWPWSSRIGEIVSENVEAAAVLGDANRLEVLDPFAAPEPLEDGTFLVVPLRGDDQRDRPAHGLGRRVAEHAFGPRVPTCDDALERLADDGVVGRVDDGRQPRPSFLRAPALAHVTEDQDGPDRQPAPVPHGGGAVLDGSLRPVTGDEDGVVRQAGDHTSSYGLQGRVLDRLPCRFVDNLEDNREGPADGVGPLPAGQGFRHAIHKRDSAVGISADDRVADARERQTQPFGMLGPRLLDALARLEDDLRVLQGDGTELFVLVVQSRHQRPPIGSAASAVPSTRALTFAKAVSQVLMVLSQKSEKPQSSQLRTRAPDATAFG
jgi:hypothetical protein